MLQCDHPDISFASASDADIEVILRFFKELFDRYEDTSDVPFDKAYSWCERKIQKYLDEYNLILYQGEKAGYIRVHPDGDRVELDDLYLFSQFRGKGIGAAVLRACIREAGVRPVYLCVYSGNVRAVALYQRLGFRVIETVSPTRVIMQREPQSSDLTEQSCVFCKIVSGELPCRKIYEDEQTLAFLDAAKDVDGHILVIPKKHCKNILECDSATLNAVMQTVQNVSLHLVRQCGYDGINLLHASGESAGQSVSHFHVHIIPRQDNDGIDAWPKFDGAKQEPDAVFKRIMPWPKA